MAFSRSKFQKLASKLIKVTAGDLVKSATFVFTNDDWDYNSQSDSVTTEVVDKALVTGFKGSAFEADSLQKLKVEVGDIKMIVTATDLSKKPTQSTTVEFDGVKHSVLSCDDVGGAGAAYILQLRA